MSTWQIVVLVGGVLAALTLLALSVRVVQQYEKGVQSGSADCTASASPACA